MTTPTLSSVPGLWARGPARFLLRQVGSMLACLLLLGATACSAGPVACPAIPPRSPMPREAKAENLDIPEWRQRLAGIDQQIAGTDRGAARVVFIGDSITQSWDKPVFDQAFGQYAPANLGLWGDFTQGALYRLGPGHQWDGFRPRLAVLLIGTNNGQWGGQPADTALGIAEVVRLIRSRSPGTKVLILGILPRGADTNEPLRAVNAAVNQQVRRCADGRSVFYLDAGPALLEPDGKLLGTTAFDGLHLTPAGYARLAAVLRPEVERLTAR